ncbi:phospholipase D-like domain-containing protein [Sulfurimonas sp.]|uniref:phospholipase D-like domain-containing protein n=1 Tax=Sulfurimonas sp. TaxID=2022749 RepID=UPI003564020D
MKFFLILILSINIHALEKIYFLPEDAKKTKKHIEKLIEDSKVSIDIAMYNFGYKKFAKLLDKAHARGVKVKIFYDKKDVYFNAIETKTVDKKLHTKIAIFDKKTVVFGSANWTKKSFKENYEVIYVTDNKKILSEFNNFFNELTNLP